VYLLHNTVARLRNVYTSRAIPTAWYHFRKDNAFMAIWFRRQQ